VIENEYRDSVTAVLGPVLVVLVLLPVDLWVYRDAKRCADEGAPVVLRIGRFAVATPASWLLGCLLLWIFFFPMYVLSRSR
jgi:hypothetical protein